jgi:hypothetical protein
LICARAESTVEIIRAADTDSNNGPQAAGLLAFFRWHVRVCIAMIMRNWTP